MYKHQVDSGIIISEYKDVRINSLWSTSVHMGQGSVKKKTGSGNEPIDH